MGLDSAVMKRVVFSAVASWVVKSVATCSVLGPAEISVYDGDFSSSPLGSCVVNGLN